MRNKAVRLVGRWSLVPITVAAAFAVNRWCPQIREARGVVFLAAVTVCTWYGGVGPGLAATALSVLLLDYFFVPPLYQIDLAPAVASSLVAFVAAAVLINSLNHRRRRIETVLRLQNRRKSEFMAVLAHELRNFLSPVSTSLAVLEHAGDPDERTERARATLRRQVGNMTRLVDDLLEAARMDEGKAQVELAPVELQSVIRDAVDAVRPASDAREHLLSLAIPEEPIWLEADRTRLEQVFVNLLTNAVKYTPPGGAIVVAVTRRFGEVIVSTRDNGTGLAPDVLPHVFERFVQGTAGSAGGLGIGLSLVRGLVELHGGSVEATSDGPGRGSEFRVRLPLPSAAWVAKHAAEPALVGASGDEDEALRSLAPPSPAGPAFRAGMPHMRSHRR